MRSFRLPARAIAGALLGGALVVTMLAAPADALPTSALPMKAVPAETPTGSLSLSKPIVSGTLRVGSTLRVSVRVSGAVSPVLRYDWLRDGRRIGGAHAPSYRLKGTDRTHRISVRVTARASGHTTAVRASTKSKRIRPRAIDDPASSQVVVNKRRPLKPKSYAPKDLVRPRGIANANAQPVRRTVARAIERMHAAARRDGVELRMLSAYRSYRLQVRTFDAYVARDGRKAAETYSARPGHSEHQTGLAVDFGGAQGCAFEFCFAGTSAGKWLKRHAAEYGFILRYPKGYTRITGYIYEPYHFRYVGSRTALDMKRKKIRTLEQYRGLKPAPVYR